MSEIGNFLVKKSNDLMVARYSMTVNEQRLMLACISQIPMDETITSEFEFVLTTEQAQELFYTEKGKHNIYRDMKEAVSALWHREVKIPLENGDVLQTRFVSSIIWVADQNTIKVNFAPKILPYLTLLKGNFTRYRMNNVVQLTSFYAVRIYELLVTWSQNGKIDQKEIEIDELKQILDIEENYKQIGDLKKRVIDVAISQINENTDFTVSVEFKKRKRAFHWIVFKFEQKADVQAAEQSKRVEREQRSLQNLVAKQNRMIREQKQAHEQKLTEVQTQWETMQTGTKLRRTDGTIWVKEQGGFLHCAEKKTTAPPMQVVQLLASGEFTVLENETPNFRQPEIVTEHEQPPATNNDTRQEFLQMLKEGLITKEEFKLLIS